MTQRNLYLICYDVACPRRWRAVHKLLTSYRVAGQLSVFECLLTAAELAQTVATLRGLIDATADRVHVLALDARMPCEGWGRAAAFAGGPLVVA